MYVITAFGYTGKNRQSHLIKKSPCLKNIQYRMYKKIAVIEMSIQMKDVLPTFL